MKLLQEFREFAMRGNVIDLAVAVVIGGAFNKIITSFVENIIMPPINLITAKYGVNFKEYAISYPVELPKKDEAGNALVDSAGQSIMETVNYTILNVGPFIQTVFDFVLLAASIFLAVRTMNKLQARFTAQKAAEEKVSAPSEEVMLLRDIRDSLKR